MTNAAKPANALRVKTGTARGSYVNVFKARKNDLKKDANGQPTMEFSIEFLIPKTDKDTKAKLDAAVDAARAKVFGDKTPGNFKNPIKDGDTLETADGEERKETKGSWVVRAASKDKPSVVAFDSNKDLQEVEDPNDFVSGDYCKATITASAYDIKEGGKSVSRGVTFYLGNVLVVRRGEPLGTRRSAQDEFAEDFEDAEEVY